MKKKINKAIKIEHKITRLRKRFTCLNRKRIQSNRRYIAAVAKETRQLEKEQQTISGSWIELVNMRLGICDEQGDRRVLLGQLMKLAEQCKAAHYYYFARAGPSTTSISSARHPSTPSFFTASIDADVNKGVHRLQSWLDSIQQVRAQLDDLRKHFTPKDDLGEAQPGGEVNVM